MIIPIAFATDDNYALPLSVAIQSIKNHKNKNIFLEIYILESGLSEENIQLISTLNSSECKIEFINVKDFLCKNKFYLSDYSATQHVSLTTYFRFVAPILLSMYDKILYLDCDIIVRECISNLYNENLNGKLLGACRDMYFNNDYFNAGILLIDVNKFLANDICNQCINCLNENDKLPYLDQDALNIVCKGDVELLKPNYNYYSITAVGCSYYMRMVNIEKIKDLKIIHFVSNYKPWIYKNLPFANFWWKEANSLPKKLKQTIKRRYKANLNYKKFEDKAFKYYFGSKPYKFIVRIKKKLFKSDEK